ncbi:hypothetical protein HispidOSU_017047, partial [Sigmodon hispidus]
MFENPISYSVCIYEGDFVHAGREQRHQSSTYPWSDYEEIDIHLDFTMPALRQGHPKAALQRDGFAEQQVFKE